MNKDDISFYLLIGDFALQQADRQSRANKMFLKRFETLENILITASKVSKMPDDEEKQQALTGLLNAIERLSNLAPLGVEIRDDLARDESHREKLEAFLHKLEEHAKKS